MTLRLVVRGLWWVQPVVSGAGEGVRPSRIGTPSQGHARGNPCLFERMKPIDPRIAAILAPPRRAMACGASTPATPEHRDPGDATGTGPPRTLPRRFLVDLVLVLGIALAAVILATRFVAIPWTVSGRSMEPTLAPGDRVIVDLWSYRRRDPRPGEIALFLGPGDLPLVKRIAGPSGNRNPSSSAIRIPARPGESRFLVLGDNPADSADSRQFGPVPAHRFVGRIVWRYWPLRGCGRVR